jgi:putative transposase
MAVSSITFGLRCREAGVQPSMGSVGDAYDNALCESSFASLECELLERQTVYMKTRGGATPVIARSRPGVHTPSVPSAKIGAVSVVLTMPAP